MAFFMATKVLCPRNFLQLSAAAMVLAMPATGQGLMELRLKDGRVLVGKVVKKGDTMEVRTHGGNVRIAVTDIAKSRKRTELMQAFKALANKSGNSMFAHVNLAKAARDYGLEPEMWRQLDLAINKLNAEKVGNEVGPVERRLRDFLAQLEPELFDHKLRQAPLQQRVLAMLRQFHAGTKAGKAEALLELLVREPGADQYLRQQARRSTNDRQRIAALEALQRRRVTGNERFVLRTTVLDRSKKVRQAAISIGKPMIKARDVIYMASGLAHSNPKVRTRTAEALGGLGHPEAINLLVKAGPHAASGLALANGGGQARGHVAFLKQTSYVRDFDVEVASAAFIADPKIDVLQEGQVLDVTVMGVSQVRTIVRAYRSALKQLTNKDPGSDPRRWAEWLDKLAPPSQPAETGKH